ncbi:hypothetical protein CapIbe_019896 [Capra ibex]
MLSAVVPKELSPRGRAAALQPGHVRPPASRPGPWQLPEALLWPARQSPLPHPLEPLPSSPLDRLWNSCSVVKSPGRFARLLPTWARPPRWGCGVCVPRGCPELAALSCSMLIVWLFVPPGLWLLEAEDPSCSSVSSLTPGPAPRSGLSDFAGGHPGSSVAEGWRAMDVPLSESFCPAPPGTLSNPGFFNYGVETHKAYEKRSLSSDIIEEQKKLQEADLVIFQFPLYWFSVPAVLKGWMDRVLCQGFAFDFPGSYDDGFLKGKLAILSLTTGGTASMFSKTGVNGDFRYFLWPLQHGTLHFCGFKVLAPQISFSPEMASEEERKRMVASWAQRLKTIWEEEPIPCSPPWYFGQ